MEERALAHAADSVLAERITRKMLVIVGLGTGRRNRRGHRREPSIPVKGICQAINEAQSVHG